MRYFSTNPALIFPEIKDGKKKRWREGLGLSNFGFGWVKNKKTKKFVVEEREGELVREIYNTFLRKDVKIKEGL